MPSIELPDPVSAEPLRDATIRRATVEVYQQINHIADIAASSEAVSSCLKGIESGDLDQVFAEVDNQLTVVADEVSQGCSTSLASCRETETVLGESIAAFSEISGAFADLNQSTRRIQDVTDVIAAFVKRTSLLALNARIEAARAGEHGRGFGVVSEEVGKLAASIRTESEAIQQTVTEITRQVKGASKLIEAEVQRNQHQKSAVTEMVKSNENLLAHGKKLPALVAGLDRFLEPLEQARQAANHNRMMQVTAANAHRDLSSIHAALRDSAPADDAVPPGTLETFIESLAQILTEGRETNIEQTLTGLLDAGCTPEECLDAVGKAVQAANMRQKRRHVAVGDYYFNFLMVERAIGFLETRMDQPPDTGMKVVLGNARGDYHSLGRQMVGMFLRSAGIEVIDVGMGAEAQAFAEAVVRSGARVVGVSSLLVESAKQIKKIRAALDARGHRHARIVAGGACFVVDPDFYTEVGADFVATAASDMIGIVRQVYEYAPMQYGSQP